MKAVKRIAPLEMCCGRSNCPDFLELDNGDFAIIGENITALAHSVLPADVGVGPNEVLIRVPRALITQSKANIPDV